MNRYRVLAFMGEVLGSFIKHGHRQKGHTFRMYDHDEHVTNVGTPSYLRYSPSWGRWIETECYSRRLSTTAWILGPNP
jgi:hypothetical protein